MENLPLKIKINKAAGVYSVYRLIESDGDFFLISRSLENLIRGSKTKPGFKDSLKIIISTLIDSLWLTTESYIPQSLPVQDLEIPLSQAKTSRYTSRNIYKSDSLSTSLIKDLSLSVRSEDFYLRSESPQKKVEGVTSQSRQMTKSSTVRNVAKQRTEISVTIPDSAVKKRRQSGVDNLVSGSWSYDPIKFFNSRG